MEPLDYWRLCDELSVMQAALLIIGEDPSSGSAHCEGWDIDKRPRGYEAAKTAVLNALRNGGIEGEINAASDCDINGNPYPISDSIDINHSRVDVGSLRKWLASRGFVSGFFFPEGADAPDYLDPKHENYALKLSAAIAVWQAITSNPDSTSGTSVKQAMLKWLRKHADQYGLTKDDGNPNDQGIEEIAKIANWDTKGGAPKTPGG